MTRHKGFKRLVRERMARTGERYAAARRALDPVATTWSHGAVPPPSRTVHPQARSLTTLLELRGIRNGLTGRPFTGEEILGIGGGLGAGYILWQFHAHDVRFLTLGFSNRWQYPLPWFEVALGRLGIEPAVFETSGARGAAAKLDELLDGGEPVIAWLDPQPLWTWGLPGELSGYLGTTVVVTGRQSAGYVVDERGDAPIAVDADTLAAARGRVVSYKHRLLGIPAGSSIEPERVREAYRAGLADQVEHLRSTSTSFGLPAWRKWSRMLVDRGNAKGWPRVFGDRIGLFGALLSIVEAVDGEIGAGGGHLRDRYADFLATAAEALERSALLEAADAWRSAGDLWEDLADAAVPAALPGAAEAVEAAEELRAAARTGEPGRARALEAADRLWGTRDRYARAFPLPAADVGVLLADLSGRLAAIHAVEVAAVDASARAIER